MTLIGDLVNPTSEMAAGDRRGGERRSFENDDD